MIVYLYRITPVVMTSTIICSLTDIVPVLSYEEKEGVIFR